MPSQAVFKQQSDEGRYAASNGAPYESPYSAQRIGQSGPLLLQDFQHIDLLAHFDRERIPERVVHAKGAGAHGYFEVTHDISHLSAAKLFSAVGTRSPASVRFSTVGGESGSPDTARDPRGFSVKIKTDDGNWDMVYNNTPVFFIRDPAKFPHFIHTQKRDPQTHLKDADMFWDYLGQNPESIHQVMILFSDRGVPDSLRRMHGYSGHTFKFVNDKGEWVYTQVHLRADAGAGFTPQDEAVKAAGEAPDRDTRDLFEAIERGDYPSWTAYVQTMTQEQAEKFRYNVLDLTKVWPHSEFPLQPFGKLVLDKNPENYFAEVEQIAFAPSHLVPGIEPSADPVLQSRLFSYPDTQRYRLGANYQQLPVNAPLKPPANFQRDGQGTFHSQGARPNYASSILPLKYDKRPDPNQPHNVWLGAAIYDLSEVTELDFEQPRALWQRVFDDAERERFVQNVAGHIGGVQKPEIVERQLAVFAAVDQSIADRLAKALGRSPVKPLQTKPAKDAARLEASLAK